MTINRTVTLRSSRYQWIITIIALGVLVIALWLPYGLNFAGYGDEWVTLTYAEAGAPLVNGSLRMFYMVPYILAYRLTPDSFVGMNIVLAIMMFGRGLAIYGLLRRLLAENPALALVAGGLSVVYPGDMGFYALVCVNITTALVFFLAALVALIDYWHNPRWHVILLMWAALGFSVGIYEISYPLILAVPLILVYLNGGLNKRVIRVSALWYFIPLIYVIFVFAAQSTNLGTAGYQLSIVNPDNSLTAVFTNFAMVYVREFAMVWQWAALNMPQGISDSRTWLVLVTALVMGMALLTHTPTTNTAFPFRKGIIVIVGAAIGFALGYSLFAFTISRESFVRTLFYALPFASIIMAVLVLLLTRLERIPRLVIALVFAILAVIYFSQTNRLSAVLVLTIAVGFLVKTDWRYSIIGTSLIGIAGANAMGFHQLQPFADLPERQHQLATAIVEQAPAIKSHTLILWIAAREAKYQFETVINRYDILQSMMQFIYQQYDIEAQICIPDGMAWGDYNTSCQLEQDAVTITFVNAGSPVHKQWSYDRVIAFTTDPNTGVVLLNQIPPDWMSETGGSSYNPQALIDHNAPLPYRLQTVWDIPG